MISYRECEKGKPYRESYIDIARGIAMILVIAGYFMLDYGNYPIRLFITSFHIPLFFVIHGLTIKPQKDIYDYLGYIKKKVLLLYLPYLIVAAVFCTPSIEAVNNILYGSHHSIHNSGGNGALWFLPCLFIADIIWSSVAAVITKISNRRVKGFVILLVFPIFGLASWSMSCHLPEMGFPFSVDVALSGAIFISIGFLFRKIIDNCSFTTRKWLCISGASLLITIILVPMNLIKSEGSLVGLGMVFSRYGHYPIFLIQGVVGSMFVLGMAKILDENMVLQLIGRDSLIIYFIHQVFIFLIENALISMGINYGLGHYCFFVIFVACISTVFSELIKLIHREQIEYTKWR